VPQETTKALARGKTTISLKMNNRKPRQPEKPFLYQADKVPDLTQTVLAQA
jgi:hypothetical protein